MRNKRRIVGILVLLAVAFAAPACNTMRGIGKDVQRVGEKIQEWTH